jgi:siroheme synthase (precorrin-2 oxidase/ferrochelatase)
VLARRLRETLEKTFPPEYGDLVDLLWHLRRQWEPRALAAGVPAAARKQAWEQVLDLLLLPLLREHETDKAVQMALKVLEAALENHA